MRFGSAAQALAVMSPATALPRGVCCLVIVCCLLVTSLNNPPTAPHHYPTPRAQSDLRDTVTQLRREIAIARSAAALHADDFGARQTIGGGGTLRAGAGGGDDDDDAGTATMSSRDAHKLMRMLRSHADDAAAARAVRR